MREITRSLLQVVHIQTDDTGDKRIGLQEYEEETGEMVGTTFEVYVDSLKEFIVSKLNTIESNSDTNRVAVCFINDITEIAEGLYSGGYNFDFVKKRGKDKVKVSVHSLLFENGYSLHLKKLSKWDNQTIYNILMILYTNGQNLKEYSKEAGLEGKQKELKISKKFKKRLERLEKLRDSDNLDDTDHFYRGNGLLLGRCDYNEELHLDSLSGSIVSFEGGEGSGKSTQIKRLSEKLRELGYRVELYREPGGSKISEQIREVILAKDNSDMSDRCEALCFAAARAQLLDEKIKKDLANGKVVLLDRYIDSNYVYQGMSKGLGLENIKNINDFAIDGMYPTLTFYLDVPVEVGFRRIEENNRETNKFEDMDFEFHKTIRNYYKELARLEDRIVEIDANAEQDEVFDRIFEVLTEKFNI